MLDFGNHIATAFKTMFVATATAAVIGTAVIGGGAYAIKNHSHNKNYAHIPKTESVQFNAVRPSDLEVKLENKDSIPGKETYLVIQGKSYALKYDETGKPVLNAYTR